jgi:DNA-binding transcriptional regulator YiaG
MTGEKLTVVPTYTRQDVTLAYNEILTLVQQLGKEDGLHAIAERIAQLRGRVKGEVRVSVLVPELARPGDTLAFSLEDEEPHLELERQPAEEARKIAWNISGKEIRRYRLSRKLSQTAFGAVVGYSVHEVYRWEREEHPVRIPRHVARFIVLFKLLDEVYQKRFTEEVTADLPVGRPRKGKTV